MSDYVFNFLMDLSDTYDNVRGQILLMDPMPSLNKTFSIVLLEEIQREMRTSVFPVFESSAMFVNKPREIPTKRFEKSKIIYQRCGKTGHTRDKCYILIGFHETSSSQKFLKIQIMVALDLFEEFTKTPQNHSIENVYNNTPSLSSEQLHRLMSLLNTRQDSQATTSHLNMTGPLFRDGD